MTHDARNRAIGAALALAVFLIDQGVKYWVTGPMGLNQVGDVLPVLPIFALRFTQNFGVSLGMFTASSDAARWILVGITGLIALVVTVWLARERKLGEILALALILGGALGNIRDRVQLGYVVDYADLHFGSFRPFLIFNIADAAITIGVVIILARALFLRDKRDHTTDDRPDEAPETVR